MLMGKPKFFVLRLDMVAAQPTEQKILFTMDTVGIKKQTDSWVPIQNICE
jgi:hypothetical protein